MCIFIFFIFTISILSLSLFASLPFMRSSLFVSLVKSLLPGLQHVQSSKVPPASDHGQHAFRICDEVKLLMIAQVFQDFSALHYASPGQSYWQDVTQKHGTVF